LACAVAARPQAAKPQLAMKMIGGWGGTGHDAGRLAGRGAIDDIPHALASHEGQGIDKD
jgi:hypothetical protein